MQSFEDVREEGYGAGLDFAYAQVCSELRSKVALRDELTPTPSAAEAYNAKTSGLREALALVLELSGEF